MLRQNLRTSEPERLLGGQVIQLPLLQFKEAETQRSGLPKVTQLDVGRARTNKPTPPDSGPEFSVLGRWCWARYPYLFQDSVSASFGDYSTGPDQ